MRKPIIKKGDKYNRLTAVRFDHRDKGKNAYWLFRCDCGNEKVAQVSNVKSGNIKSCGCLLKEVKTTHGMYLSREYKTWQLMKARCLNKKNSDYKKWGGRGIKICDRWLKFKNFYKDMGKKPKGKSLDRIDNNGNYEPDNCRWATREEQANNKRNNHLLAFKNKTITLAQWSRETGIKYDTLKRRIYSGWSIERALTT